MNVTDELKDKIKSTVKLSDFIGKRVSLKRKGREFSAISPFTNEKTPSFFVNDEKAFYHCFSSGRHGDVISFAMDFENLPFVEAVKLICEEFNIDYDESIKSNTYNRKAELYRCARFASEYFKKQLLSPSGSSAREYLRARGLDKQTISQFNIGFSTNESLGYLLSNGFSEKDVVESGLAMKSDNGGIWYPFKNRVMFPIKDNIGRVVAFSGRSISKEKEAKYINSPETEIFKKRETLYNIQNARRAASDDNPIIIVEGFMDVIALSSAGLKTSISPMGTSLTEEHIKSIWSVSREPVVCMDGDRAGRQASQRIVEKALPYASHSKSMSFLFLPNEMDPDEYILKHGKGSFIARLSKTTSMIDFIWNQQKSLIPLNTPERKSDLRNRIFSITEAIQDKNVKYYYRKELLSRFDKEIHESWKVKKTRFNPSLGTVTDVIQKHEKTISCLPVLFPEILESVKEFMSSIHFVNINAENIRSAYEKCLTNGDYYNIEECVLMNIDSDDADYIKSFQSEVPKDLTSEQAIDVWNFAKDMYSKETS